MAVTIRKATIADCDAMMRLVEELAAFENATDKLNNSAEQMRQEFDSFECFVAENVQQEIIGMALYYFAYYTWVGKSLYLDDLYVKQAFRGQKIGTQLLSKIFEVARQEQCKRVRWQVLHWNSDAIAMYKKCGAAIDDQWHNCDFDEQGIVQFRL